MAATLLANIFNTRGIFLDLGLVDIAYLENWFRSVKRPQSKKQQQQKMPFSQGILSGLKDLYKKTVLDVFSKLPWHQHLCNSKIWNLHWDLNI